MLRAKRVHLVSQEYEVTEDGQALTTCSLGRGRIGARFTLRAVDHVVRVHRLSGVHELLDAEDTVLATTDRVGRSWNMMSSGRVVPFRQTGLAGRECGMLGDGAEPIGTIRRTGGLQSEVTADLPGLDLAHQIFAISVVLLRWRRKRTAAVRSGSNAGF